MAKLSYSRQALTDLERLGNFLSVNEPGVALHTLKLIDEAISILCHHPLIGRLAESDLRELVISQGKTGYLALYSYQEAYDAVLILAIRHQREAGFLTGA